MARIKKQFADTLRQLHATGVDLVIIGAPPRAAFSIPDATVKSLRYSSDGDIVVSESDYHPTVFLGALASSTAYYRSYIDVEKVFCEDDACSMATQGKPRFFDATHLTKTASRELEYLFFSDLLYSDRAKIGRVSEERAQSSLHAPMPQTKIALLFSA